MSAPVSTATPGSKISTFGRWIIIGIALLIVKSCFFPNHEDALIGTWRKVYGGDIVTFRPHDMTVRGLMEGVGTYDVEKYEADGDDVTVHYVFQGSVQKRKFTVINSDKISSYGAEYRRD